MSLKDLCSVCNNSNRHYHVCIDEVTCQCECNVGGFHDVAQKVSAITFGVGLTVGGIALTILSGGVGCFLGGTMISGGMSSISNSTIKIITKEKMGTKDFLTDVGIGSVTGLLTGGVGAIGEAVVGNTAKALLREGVKAGITKGIGRTVVGSIVGATGTMADQTNKYIKGEAESPLPSSSNLVAGIVGGAVTGLIGHGISNLEKISCGKVDGCIRMTKEDPNLKRRFAINFAGAVTSSISRVVIVKLWNGEKITMKEVALQGVIAGVQFTILALARVYIKQSQNDGDHQIPSQNEEIISDERINEIHELSGEVELIIDQSCILEKMDEDMRNGVCAGLCFTDTICDLEKNNLAAHYAAIDQVHFLEDSQTFQKTLTTCWNELKNGKTIAQVLQDTLQNSNIQISETANIDVCPDKVVDFVNQLYNSTNKFTLPGHHHIIYTTANGPHMVKIDVKNDHIRFMDPNSFSIRWARNNVNMSSMNTYLYEFFSSINLGITQARNSHASVYTAVR